MHYKVKIYPDVFHLEKGINEEYLQGYRLSRILELLAPSRFLIVYEKMPFDQQPKLNLGEICNTPEKL